MARPCSSCKHPKRDEIDRKLKGGTSFIDVERWLAATGQPTITSQSIASHAKEHLGVASVIGRRTMSADLAEAIRDVTHEMLASGELTPTLKDGLAASSLIDKRAARTQDRDLVLKISMALTGQLPSSVVRVIDPDVEAIEAEFRPLLTSGD